jgi:hypothetical protein
MKEKDIKIKVIEYLIKNEKHFIVVPEIGLGNNSANARGLSRADIFSVNEFISIYEIKTENDTLKRLQSQLETYKKYANKVNIVIAEKFLKDIDDLDKNIGIFIIKKNNKIEKIRDAILKKLPVESYLSYWWGIELKKLFKGCKGNNLLKYQEGIEKLRNLLNDEQIENLTLFRLKERYKEESDFIKKAIKEKKYELLFPKREYQKNINVTPLEDIPFGVINPFC